MEVIHTDQEKFLYYTNPDDGLLKLKDAFNYLQSTLTMVSTLRNPKLLLVPLSTNEKAQTAGLMIRTPQENQGLNRQYK